ncbi:MAG: LysR family transcriptional regulator [Bacillota bacterium]|nr:LysR family transcriptional regulator [Bacillota bacterium]
MDIRKYGVFLRVADWGSLTRAGEELGYTQSGISHMIKSLEEEAGVPLLVRRHSGVTLTAEGEALLPILRELVSWGDRLEQVSAALRGVETGRISIGVFFSISHCWMPDILQQFEREHPNITVDVLEGGSGDIESWLTEGRIDLGLFSRQPHYTFEWIPLMREQLMAVLPTDHPLAFREEVAVEELLKEPYIMQASQDASAVQDQDLYNYLKGRKQTPRVKYSSNNDYAIVRMVEKGLGVSILPNLIVREENRDIAVRPLSPAGYRELGIAYRGGREPSPAMEEFIHCTKDVLARMGVSEE